MEISLRKAYSFSKALIEQSKALSLKNNIEVSIYTSNVDEDVSKAIDLFQKNLEIFTNKCSKLGISLLLWYFSSTIILDLQFIQKLSSHAFAFGVGIL